MLQLMGLKVPGPPWEIQFSSKDSSPWNFNKAQPSENMPFQNSPAPLKSEGGGGSYPEISEDSLLFCKIIVKSS